MVIIFYDLIIILITIIKGGDKMSKTVDSKTLASCDCLVSDLKVNVFELRLCVDCLSDERYKSNTDELHGLLSQTYENLDYLLGCFEKLRNCLYDETSIDYVCKF